MNVDNAQFVICQSTSIFYEFYYERVYKIKVLYFSCKNSSHLKFIKKKKQLMYDKRTIII